MEEHIASTAMAMTMAPAMVSAMAAAATTVGSST
jgi:hypothetical protein